MAQHKKDGIKQKDFLAFLNKRYPQFLFGFLSQKYVNTPSPQPTNLITVKSSVRGPKIESTLLTQQPNLLKYVTVNLSENSACIFAFEYVNDKGVSAGHAMSLFKNDKDQLMLLDGQMNLIIVGLENINEYFVKRNVTNLHLVVYKNNPDWGSELKLPPELLQQQQNKGQMISNHSDEED